MKVEYMCHSGSDLLVVDAARASFGKQSALVDADEEKIRVTLMLAETAEGSAKYKKLLNYLGKLEEWKAYAWSRGDNDPQVLKYEDYNLTQFLARERHLLPFRHPTITFRCKAPLFVARQLGKHQTGMSWSEESRRYITTEPEFFWPDAWRKRADNVKQGSSDDPVPFMVTREHKFMTTPQALAESALRHALFAYEEMLAGEVAPELARMVLPQNMYITWVWTGTLLSWVHMIKERTAPTTQRETQQFALMVSEHLDELYPVSMEALLADNS